MDCTHHEEIASFLRLSNIEGSLSSQVYEILGNRPDVLLFPCS